MSGNRRGPLRSRVREGYELVLSAAIDLVSRSLGERHLSPLDPRSDSSRVNLSAVGKRYGTCQRLPTSLFCDCETTINFLLYIVHTVHCWVEYYVI